MIYYTGTREISLRSTAVALGKFDGLHKGHQILFNKLQQYKAMGYQTVIFTFDFHPMNLLSGKKQRLIYTKEERRQIIEEMNIDVLIEFPFTMETAHMLPEDFVKNVLVEKLGAEVIVVGDDFHFGYQRAGDVAFLKTCEARYGFKVDNCEKLCIGDREISATMARDYVVEGDMEMVRTLLGRPFAVSGTVIRGKGNGRTVQMPTANIAPHEEKLLPPDGVYATRTRIGDDETEYDSVTNIGRNPTVADNNDLRVETFLMHYEGDLYDREITVDFYCRLRGEVKFENLNALRAQVAADQVRAEDYFKALDAGREDGI